MTLPKPLCRSSAPLRGLTLAALLAGSAARAQEVPEVPEAPEVPEVPAALKVDRSARKADLRALPWRVVGFVDPADTSCDPLEARYGGCIELVEFPDLSRVWNPSMRAPREVSSALRSITSAGALAWETLAYRWFMDDQAPAKTARADGIEALPSPADTWDAGTPARRRTVSMPDRAAWLDGEAWTGPKGLFHPAIWSVPTGEPTPPTAIMLYGRFASRLGYQGRAHPYEIMDADPTSSAPFFEQMFPYESASENFGPEAVPLSAYAWPDQLNGLSGGAGWADRVVAAGMPLLEDDTLPAYVARVHRAFEEEYDRLLGVSVASYALEDFTINQMRVLAALNLMRAPPGLLARQSGRSRDIVAAALGQADSTSEASERIDRTVFSFQGGFELKYEQIPADVVDTWLRRLLRERPPEPALIQEEWGPALLSQLRDVLKPSVSAPEAMDPDTLDAWLVASLRTGLEVGPFKLEAARLTLRTLVWSLPDDVREEKETWILLDHVHDTISAGLVQTRGELMTPEEVVAQTVEAWSGTISAHGRRTRPIPQGLGAVDPTAICTTLDGRSALSEPSIGVLNLDLVVAANAGKTSAEEVLWEKRDALPWVLVDDPQTSVPTLTALAQLSDGRTLYRVRWKIWSGWHLMWAPESLPTGQRRMAVRTAAICEDMALTEPAMVPTLVRAGMLLDSARPTTPVSPAKAREITRAERALKDDAAPPPDHSAEISYIQALARRPLQALAGETRGLMVMAVELSNTGERARVKRFNAPTPYIQLQRGVGRGLMRATAWGLYFPASAAAPSGIIPDLRPDESVATNHPRPTWHPVVKTDWDASGGLNYMPLRWTQFSCQDLDGTLGSVAPCSESDSGGSLLSEGLGVDLSTGTTFWFQDSPRLSAELGATVRLDMVHSGNSAIYNLFAPSDTPDWLPDGPTYDWTFRYAAGPVVGLRYQPLPGGLWRRGDGWPWGAERPDGKTRLGRWETGLRAGILFGPGYNGLEATALGEIWAARSVHVNSGPYASFTPYHPRILVGPFVRGQVGFLPFGEGEARTLVLDSSVSGLVGVRAQLRLQTKAGALPEAP